MINRTKNLGFTLLEMLISLGLMAMLMLAMTQLMSHGAEIWNNSDRDIRAVENDKVAIDFIRKMLQRAKPLTWEEPNEAGEHTKIFVGETNELLFVAPLPIVDAEQQGMYLFSVSVQKTDEYVNKALVVKYWPLDEESLEKTQENEPGSDVIMTDVASVNFSYFGDKEYSDGLEDPEWQTDWLEIRDFPLAVRMSLKRTNFNPDDPDMAERMEWKGIVFMLLTRTLR